MANSYMQPDVFRMHLNSMLQALRNVTFLLQKQKNELPGYEDWYTNFVKNVCPQPLMRWSVKSRNRVVKESDLELLSEARIRWVLNWLQKSERRFTFPPRMSTREMLTAIFSDPGNPCVGVITLNRRWVDKALPDYELLHATREVFIELSRLLVAAHEAAGVAACDLEARELACITSQIASSPMGCMEINPGVLQEHVDLSDGLGIREVIVPVERDERRVQKSIKRYGGRLSLDGETGPIAMASQVMKVAIQILQRDKHHMNLLLLFRQGKIIEMMSPHYADQSSKYVSFHRIADRVESVRADGMLFLCEAWWAEGEVLDDAGSLVPARDRKDRREALQAFAVTRDGTRLVLTTPFSRTRLGKIVIEETLEESGDAVGYFGPMVPIQERWRQMDARKEF
jgi:hypothetical protein